MFTIDFSDLTSIVSGHELVEDYQERVEDMMRDIYVDLTAPPPLGTPVDTGEARNSWQLDLSDPMSPEVWTDSPYMKKLNNGHSQQSPAGFIDAIVDKHTR